MPLYYQDEPIQIDNPTGDSGGGGGGFGGRFDPAPSSSTPGTTERPTLDPAIVTPMQRPEEAPDVAPELPVTITEEQSKARRNRAMYTDIKRTNAPRTSGINL